MSGGWLLTPFLQKIGPVAAQALRQRVAAELTTTFKSHYAREISLSEALDPDVIAEYGRRATGAEIAYPCFFDCEEPTDSRKRKLYVNADTGKETENPGVDPDSECASPVQAASAPAPVPTWPTCTCSASHRKTPAPG